MFTLDAAQTAAALPYPALVSAVRQACGQQARGEISSPPRHALPLADGGVMLSMPAAAPDLAVHKLVNVCPGNRTRGLDTLQGVVTALDPTTGQPLFLLDASTLTARRTAALSLVGIAALHGPPREVALIGTGHQARAHAEALADVYPAARLWVVGSSLERASTFCAQAGGHPAPRVPDSADVVVTLTTSPTPVYALPARRGRLIVAVGAFTPDAAEIAPATVRGSRVVVDDVDSALHKAGDLLQAGVQRAEVLGLAEVLDGAPDSLPFLFKTVGCAAWDLAACRVGRENTG